MFQVSNNINRFVQPSRIPIFVYYAQAWHLALTATSKQISVVLRMKKNIFEGNF